MSFQPGDRVRWNTTGEAGFPLIRYGFVGAHEHANGRVVVMLDGDLKGNTVIPIGDLEFVTITNIELQFTGSDLLDDPSLRQGLVNLWSAEADQAGLDVGLSHLGTGVVDTVGNGFALADLQSGGQHYVLRASQDETDTIHVRADLPRRWEL